ELGGMTKAIEAGVPKMRIEEAAAKKQAGIDSGQEIIVGVNRYEIEDDTQIDIRDVDNSKVRTSQINRINEVKASRDSEKVGKTLEDITACAKTGEGNLLDLAVKAARERATLGEISSAMEVAFGRHKAETKTISGVYSSAMKQDKSFEEAHALANKVAQLEGRRPRILVAKMGQDGHDRGAKVIASSFADIGFDVDVGPLFSTPAEVAKMAMENDVHFVGVSSLAAGHKTLIPELIEELKKVGRGDAIVVVGGVIPKQDYDFLYNAGVAAVFGPGTVISKAAISLLNKLVKRLAQ
ncbi:MAG TPA: methylmalonyl-CoA mutase, partial [Flavobacteriales bacterium]|nr:methylmalonyl-CoA mutase [Flavobacteriales bacterium]